MSMAALISAAGNRHGQFRSATATSHFIRTACLRKVVERFSRKFVGTWRHIANDNNISHGRGVLRSWTTHDLLAADCHQREHLYRRMPTMENVKGDNYCDSLGMMHLRYAVLSKENRIQLLVNPTRKQLRERGKRQWRLVQAIDGDRNAAEFLQQAIESALRSVESADIMPHTAIS